MIKNFEYLDKLNKTFVKKHLVFPYDFDETNDCLKIVAPAEEKKYIADNLSLFFNLPYCIEIFDKQILDDEIDKYYLSKINEPQETEDYSNSTKESANTDSLEITSEIKKTDLLYDINSDEPIIKLVNNLLIDAMINNSTDIHIEPMEEKVVVRQRLNGILYNKTTIQKINQPSITARIKILSNLDIAESRLPQDGSFQVAFAGRRVDFRVSTIPINFGERIVLRILDKSKFLLNIDNLGLSAEHYTLIKKIIHSPNGIILVTGPTGSGKTTSLYAALNELKDGKRNIITIEDPIEYQIPSINQIQVKPEIGLTFAAGLRSILRQDPDIIMIGEIRDEETMNIAIRSSLTGHLVFSTLHTNDSIAAIARLYDMGLKPYLIGSSLICVIAQRLTRILCPHCKQQDGQAAQILKSLNITIAEKQIIYKESGCAQCKNTGYSERRGLFEILMIDSKIKEMILHKKSADEIKKYCILHKMNFLRDAAINLLLKGDTSINEIISILTAENEI